MTVKELIMRLQQISDLRGLENCHIQTRNEDGKCHIPDIGAIIIVKSPGTGTVIQIGE